MSLQSELVNNPEFKKAFEGVEIYGVAGSNGSGKDTLLSLFAAYGYFIFNTGDNLRHVTKAVMGTTQRGGNHSPTGRVANAQRTTYPGGMVSLGLVDYWARILHMPKELRPKGIAIGSIRSVSEAETLKEFGGKLIVVDAKPEVRYQRMLTRARDYESRISFEQFIAEEEAEMGIEETDPAKFGGAHVLKMGDINLENDYDDIEDFLKEARKTLGITSDG